MLGERLKRAVERSGKERSEVAAAIGISEGNLYKLFKKDSFEIDYLRKASLVLGVPISYFLGDDSQIGELGLPKGYSVESEHFSERVMSTVVMGIEELKKLFEEEIRVKNQQIAGLQRTVDALVGKSRGVTGNPLSEGEAFETMMELYLGAGLAHLPSPLKGNAYSFSQPLFAKSVALGSPE